MNQFSSTIAVFLISFTLVLAQGGEEEPRLEAILREIETSQKAVAAKKEERIQKYIGDLKALEEKTQATGDLDKVLQISKEREAWSKEEPTPSIDPKDESFLLDLRKLRYYFDQDLQTISKASNEEIAATKDSLVARFEELEKVLTKEGAIDQAIKARALKEKYISGTLTFEDAEPPVSSAESPITEMPVVQNADNNSQFAFPIPDPKRPAAPEAKQGRIVFIPFPWESRVFGKLLVDDVSQKDYTNISKLGTRMDAGKIAAIRADQTAVFFDVNGNSAELSDVNAVEVWTGFGEIGMIWLDSFGNVGATGRDAGYEKELSRLKKINYLSPSRQSAFAIDESGKRYAVGPASDNSNLERVFSNLDSISDVKFGGGPAPYRDVKALFRNGSVTKYMSDESPKELSPPGTLKVWLCPVFGISVDDDPVFLSMAHPVQFGELLDTVGEEIEEFFTLGGHLQLLKTVSGKWLVIRKEGSTWVRVEQFENALGGAIDAYPVNPGIIAVFPSSSIPESGLWTLDRLLSNSRDSKE